MITIRIEPDMEDVTLGPARTVLHMLNKINRRPGECLVIRNNGLLTPDVRLQHGDHIIVRDVISRG